MKRFQVLYGALVAAAITFASATAFAGDVQISNISMFRLDLIAGAGEDPASNWYSISGGNQVLHSTDKTTGSDQVARLAKVSGGGFEVVDPIGPVIKPEPLLIERVKPSTGTSTWAHFHDDQKTGDFGIRFWTKNDTLARQNAYYDCQSADYTRYSRKGKLGATHDVERLILECGLVVYGEGTGQHHNFFHQSIDGKGLLIDADVDADGSTSMSGWSELKDADAVDAGQFAVSGKQVKDLSGPACPARIDVMVWLTEFLANPQPRALKLTHFDRETQLATQTVTYQNVIPIKYEAPSLDALAGGIATERVVFQADE